MYFFYYIFYCSLFVQWGITSYIVYSLACCLLRRRLLSIVYFVVCCLSWRCLLSIVILLYVVCPGDVYYVLYIQKRSVVCLLSYMLPVFSDFICYLLPFILLVNPYVCYLSFVHICCLLTVHMCVVNVLLRRRMSMFVQKTFFFRRVSWTWSSYFFVVYKVCFVYCLFRTHLLCPVVNTTSVICSYSVNPCYMF